MYRMIKASEDKENSILYWTSIYFQDGTQSGEMVYVPTREEDPYSYLEHYLADKYGDYFGGIADYGESDYDEDEDYNLYDEYEPIESSQSIMASIDTELEKYYTFYDDKYAVADELGVSYGDMDGFVYDIEELLSNNYGMDIVGYAIAKEPYYYRLDDNGLSLGIIGQDTNNKTLGYVAGDRFYPITLREVEQILNRDFYDDDEEYEDDI